MKVLIVVDMQNDFISGSLGSDDAKAIVDKVAEKVDKFDGKVIFTRDSHYENYLETQEGRNLPIMHCMVGTEGWHIHPSIPVKDTDMKFNKYGFGSIELMDFLTFLHQTKGIESIKFVGLCTDICVVSNALLAKAFLPEVPLIVDSSCCAGTSLEAHEAALKVMQSNQIKVV